MTLNQILEESNCAFMSHEAFREAFNKLRLAKQLAEEIEKDYEDSADWKDARPKLVKLAESFLI